MPLDRDFLRRAFPSHDRGQSNVTNMFSVVGADTPLGVEGIQDLGYDLLSNQVITIEAGKGGNALLKKSLSSGTNYFYDSATGNYDGDAGVASRNIGADVFVMAGQSNVTNMFSVVGADTPLGVEGIQDLGYDLLSNQVITIEAGKGGNALLKKSLSSGTNYFYDSATGNYDGDAGVAMLQGLNAGGGGARAIYWDQGEGDISGLNLGNVTTSELKSGLLTVFAKIRSIVGEVPVVICKLGRRTDTYSAEDKWQEYREMQIELISETSWIYAAPEKFDLDMYDETGVSDGVHLADDQYAIAGKRGLRKMLSVSGETISSVDGPSISSAVRSGTIVTVTLTHADGTDFTPTSGIEGFRFEDDGSEITISSAVRTNTTTITLTLASEPTGTEVLYYGYGILDGVTPDNLVQDNSTNILPLSAIKITL